MKINNYIFKCQTNSDKQNSAFRFESILLLFVCAGRGVGLSKTHANKTQVKVLLGKRFVVY